MSDASLTASASPGLRPLIPFPSRVVIEGVWPEIDSGKFPAKRVIGEYMTVSADVHVDGHNDLIAVLRYRALPDGDWTHVRMQSLGKGTDRYAAQFRPQSTGYYEYALSAWIDYFGNWTRDTSKKLAAGQDVSVETTEGALLLEAAWQRAQGTPDEDTLRQFKESLESASAPNELNGFFNNAHLQELMYLYGDCGRVCDYPRTLKLMVEPKYALYSTWYELFPRSLSSTPGKHGTFKDVIAHLPYVAKMGFDVLYLPPIHPIGKTKRKGKNNTLTPGPDDAGSPWAIGGEGGGHKSVHAQLGTIEEFDALVSAAQQLNINIALDIAFQCSPDHPYVKEHPEWFYHRPDKSIKYAENPPKKYEDIYPIDFESSDWESLWNELVDVVNFWVGHGVKVFRIDNPHTKPFAFWHYLIEQVKLKHPEVIFLSEAFARPKIMKQLAKCGFSQSYTYFTWRNTKRELMQYMEELTQTEAVEYFRPNFFANTPDILPENLQYGGRASFMIRATLASMLAASYGIYGPAYELCVSDALPLSEEYRDSEKYEIKNWNLDDPISIKDYITRLNSIRHEHPALHNNRSIRFLEIDNEQMLAFAKADDATEDIVVVVVNLDPFNAQAGRLRLPLSELGVDEQFQLHDLISNRRYTWLGDTNVVSLEPHVSPAYVFVLRKRLRREQDFAYFI
jgi:starch synthase (maltosyl-transferring)